jgi:hypothetical protein
MREAIDVVRQVLPVHPPRVAAVRGPEEILRAVEDRIGVVRRHLDRRVPVEAELGAGLGLVDDVARAGAALRAGPRTDAAAGPVAQIQTVDRAVL